MTASVPPYFPTDSPKSARAGVITTGLSGSRSSTGGSVPSMTRWFSMGDWL